MNPTTLLLLIVWCVLGAFFHQAWIMILGTGTLANLVFAVLWLTPVADMLGWFESDLDKEEV